MAGAHRSPRQLLEKNPSVPCLYRLKLDGIDYGAKEVSGKRKEPSPVVVRFSKGDCRVRSHRDWWSERGAMTQDDPVWPWDREAWPRADDGGAWRSLHGLTAGCGGGAGAGWQVIGGKLGQGGGISAPERVRGHPPPAARFGDCHPASPRVLSSANSPWGDGRPWAGRTRQSNPESGSAVVSQTGGFTNSNLCLDQGSPID